MLLKKSVIITTTILTLGTPALAVNWSFVGRNQDGSSHFVDQESITLDQESQAQSFRVMILVMLKDGSVNRETVFTHNLINCTEKTHKLVSFYQKGAEANLVNEHFAPIVSRSMIDNYYNFVCR
jgi:hypothetical protein